LILFERQPESLWGQTVNCSWYINSVSWGRSFYENTKSATVNKERVAAQNELHRKRADEHALAKRPLLQVSALFPLIGSVLGYLLWQECVYI